jgi:hypothetical protein
MPDNKSVSLKHNKCSTCQQMVHFHHHNSPSRVHILRQISPIHSLTSIYLRSILILFSFIRLVFPSVFYPLIFPYKNLLTRLILPFPHISFPSVQETYESFSLHCAIFSFLLFCPILRTLCSFKQKECDFSSTRLPKHWGYISLYHNILELVLFLLALKDNMDFT